MSVTIGIDIGGTKIAAGAVEDSGAVLAEDRLDTPATDPQAIVRACADLVARLTEQAEAQSGARVTAVGVACAGFVDADRAVVRFAPNLAWRDEPLRDRLTELVGLPVVIENDANAAAWGEFVHGAAAGDEEDMLLVTVGTGVGGGFVSGGRLARGTFGMASEIGHIRLVPQGLRCGCGRLGCLEVYGSGSALLRDARERVRARRPGSEALVARCGGDPERLTGRDIDDLAAQGDPAALDLLGDLGRHLADGVTSVCAVLDPGVVVLGGGVAHAGEPLLAPFRETLLGSLLGRGYRPEPKVVVATLGTRAGMLGAADLARDVTGQQQ